MTKTLILYYSSYGHIETMAEAIAEGVRNEGGEAVIKRVPETAPDDVAKAAHFKLDQAAPIATDRAGGVWMRGELNGKVGAAFTSSATQHGGQETTLFSIITNLFHFGMTIVGLDYGFAGQMRNDEVVGGAPYGATTIAGGDGSRQPSATELEGARYLGARVARTAAKLAA